MHVVENNVNEFESQINSLKATIVEFEVQSFESMGKTNEHEIMASSFRVKNLEFGESMAIA